MVTKRTTTARPHAAKPAQAPSIPFHIPDGEWANIMQGQKARAEELAARIERGEELSSERDRAMAAEMIRAFAKSIPLERKRKQGPAAKFSHGEEAMSYALARATNKEMTHGQAVAEIADRIGVSEHAVEKAIKPFRDQAFKIIGCTDPGN